MSDSSTELSYPDYLEDIVCYEGEEPFAFVSYCHRDEGAVRKVLKELYAKGMRLWFDMDLEGGEQWREAISHAIRSCTVVLYFHSANSAESEECCNEINLAYAKKKTIVPIRLDETDYQAGADLFLTSQQSVNAFKYTTEELMNDILSNVAVQSCLGSLPSEGGSLPKKGELRDKGYRIISEMCKEWKADGIIPKNQSVDSHKMNEQLSGMPLIEKDGDGNWVPTPLGRLLGIRSYGGERNGKRFTNVAYSPQLQKVLREMLLGQRLKA